MICSICSRRRAFYHRSFEGVNLCKNCFNRSIENKVRNAISKSKMLRHDDRIGIAVSGGKDSLTLLKIFKKFTENFPKAKLVGIMIDEGIKGYRDEAVDIVEETCRELVIPLTIIPFKEIYGVTLDELVNRKTVKSACAYCGVLRRRALETASRDLQVNKLATAHNLDDEVQTTLLNLFNGDPHRIKQHMRKMGVKNNEFPIRIKPLCLISEKEVTLYAYLNNIKFQKTTCPYAENALRNDMRKVVNYLENRHPGIKYSFFHSIKKLQSIFKEDGIKPKNKCRICGNMSSKDVCNTCFILEDALQSEKVSA